MKKGGLESRLCRFAKRDDKDYICRLEKDHDCYSPEMWKKCIYYYHYKGENKKLREIKQ